MTGKCPECETRYSVPSSRGSKVGDHTCPECDVPLVGVTAGRGRTEYLCPITDEVLVLESRGVQLAAACRLVFRAGKDDIGAGPGRERSEPTRFEQACLDRVAGRVLGEGCVVDEGFDPDRWADAAPALRASWRKRAGLYLVPAEDPGDASEWLVNEPVRRRPCVACRRRTPDLARRRVDREWRPRQLKAQHGRGPNRRYVDVDQGPHEAGTLACWDCDPRCGD